MVLDDPGNIQERGGQPEILWNEAVTSNSPKGKAQFCLILSMFPTILIRCSILDPKLELRGEILMCIIPVETGGGCFYRRWPATGRYIGVDDRNSPYIIEGFEVIKMGQVMSVLRTAPISPPGG